MAVKGKGIAGKSSAGKRKSISKGDDSGKAGPSKKRRPQVAKFFDDEAIDTDDDDEFDSEDLDGNDDHEPERKDGTETGKGHRLPFLLKEEQLSDNELEELLKQRYSHNSENVVYAEHDYESKGYDDPESVMHSVKDPTVWRVKCMAGREQQMAFCIIQKYIDLQSLGTKLQIVSAFALETMKGYIYIEAEREIDVIEACKGFCNLYSSKITLLPKNEVIHLLSADNKLSGVSKGTWVRMKCGKYKGDLAQVVAVDNARKRATIKLIPRIDLRSVAQKFGGGGIAKQTAVPAPRLISSLEIEDFRPHIEYRRDRQTGETFEILGGLMLKDGYLYKKVSFGSFIYGNIQPSANELQKFSMVKDADDSDWLSSVYGTSDTKRRHGFGLHDLVLFGKKDFGVIIDVDSDGCQILKGESETPEVVTVKLHEIRNGCCDMFTAPDRFMNTISIKDIVKVLEGPFQGRQGIVRHIYSGTIFIHDKNQLENSGFFCVKCNLCERIKCSKDACDENMGGVYPPGFEACKSSTKIIHSPKRPSQPDDSIRSFRSNFRGDRDGAFSVGQTLRIRVGPLKGYLCRVMAIYRSDVTVKLDSQSKVIKVNSEHLSEVRVRNYGKSISTELPLNDYGVPVGQLGSEARHMKEASKDKGAWDLELPSTAMGSWNDPSAFGISKESNLNRPWGTMSSNDNGQSDQRADPWERKTSLVGGSQVDNMNSMDGWSRATASDGDQKTWNKSTSGGEAVHSETNQIGSWETTDGWNKAIARSGDISSGTGCWENTKCPIRDQASGWSDGGDWGKGRHKTGNPSKNSNNATGGWKETVNASNIPLDGWKNSENAWDKGKDVIDNQADDWNIGSGAGNSWREEVNSQGKMDNKEQFSSSSRDLTQDQPNSGGKAKIETDNKANSWGKAVEGEITNDGANQNNPWRKASGGWKEMGGISGSQVDSWNDSAVARGNQVGGWKTAAESRTQPEYGYGHEAGGWNSGNWNEAKDRGEGEAKDWSKQSFTSEGQPDGWNMQKSFGGDDASGWKKEIRGGINNQTDSWSQRKDFDGGQSSMWRERSKNTEAAGNGDENECWNQPKVFDGSCGSGWRGRGGGRGGQWGNRGRRNGNGDENECRNQPKAFDGDHGSGWRGRGGDRGRGENRVEWRKYRGGWDGNADEKEGWNQRNTFDGGCSSEWRGGRGGDRGGWAGNRGGSDGNADENECWNQPKASNGGCDSGWRGGRGGDRGGWAGNRSGSDGNADENECWSQPKASDGGCDSGWRGGRGGDRGGWGGNAGGSGGNADENKSWNQLKAFDGGHGSGWRGGRGGDTGGWGRNGGGTDGNAYGNKSWNQPKAFDGGHRSEWRGGRGGDGGKGGDGGGWGGDRGGGDGNAHESECRNQLKAFNGGCDSGWRGRRGGDRGGWGGNRGGRDGNRGGRYGNRGGRGNRGQSNSVGQGQSYDWKNDKDCSWNGDGELGGNMSSGWDKSSSWNKSEAASEGQGQIQQWTPVEGSDSNLGSGWSKGRKESGQAGDSWGDTKHSGINTGSGWNSGPSSSREACGDAGGWSRSKSSDQVDVSGWNTLTNREPDKNGCSTAVQHQNPVEASVGNWGSRWNSRKDESEPAGDKSDSWNSSKSFVGNSGSGWNAGSASAKEASVDAGQRGLNITQSSDGVDGSGWNNLTDKEPGKEGCLVDGWNQGRSARDGDHASGWNHRLAASEEAGGESWDKAAGSWGK